MINRPFVSVVVPVFNEEKYIQLCIESLRAQVYPNGLYEIIVVDNGSTDNTHGVLDSIGVEYSVFLDGKVGAVRNYGESLAKGEVICFLDADCIAPIDWIDSGVNNLENKEVGATGGAYLLREDPSWVEKAWVLKTPTKSRSVSHLVGGTLFLRRADFKDVGGFDEGINAGEDTKLSHEVSKLGYSLYQDNKLAVTHLGYPTNIFDFLKRQFWHSSSFFKSKKSWLDKTFLLTVAFSVSFFLSFIFLAFSMYSCLILSLAIFVSVPIVFTLKKVSTVGFCELSIGTVMAALFLNFLYFFSRSVGMWLGLAYDPFKK